MANASVQQIKKTMNGNSFTLNQMLYSQTAKNKNISNAPTIPEHKQNIEHFIKNVLNPLVIAFEAQYPGIKVWIESGYRSKCLNDSIANSSSTSVHMKGFAADLKACDSNNNYYYTNTAGKEENYNEKLVYFAVDFFYKNNQYKVDQIIKEWPNNGSGGFWLHIGEYNNSKQQRGNLTQWDGSKDKDGNPIYKPWSYQSTKHNKKITNLYT